MAKFSRGKDNRYELIYAITNGDEQRAFELLHCGADVNIADDKGETALIKAIYFGCKNIALELIRYGADINIRDNEGQTALMKTIYYKNNEIAQELINHEGIDMNIRCNDGQTALMKAAYHGNTEIVQALIKRGASVNIADNFNDTALSKALHAKYKKIAFALIMNEVINVNIADNEGETPLMWSAYIGNVDIAKALIDKGADVNISNSLGNTALILAVVNGDKIVNGNNEIVVALIEAGADVNTFDEDGRTALMWATVNSNYENALALIRKNTNLNIVDDRGRTALMLSLNLKNNKIAQALIDNGCDVNLVDKEGETPLMKAAYHGKTDIVLALLNAGADVNIANKHFQTALMRTVKSGNTEIVHALIHRKGDVNFTNKHGRTALIEAVLYGENNITQALIDGGADLNISDKDGETALIKAVSKGNDEIVQALINGGADVNIANNEGKTALMLSTKHEEIFVTLIEQGKAMVNKVDNNGRTALFYAILEENHTAKYLLERGENLHLTDKFSVSVLSFAIYHFINGKLKSSQFLLEYMEIFKERGIKKHDIIKAIINAVFCKSPIFDAPVTENILLLLPIVPEVMKKENYPQKRTIGTIAESLLTSKITLGHLTEILSMLIDLGADPNTSDENGNTACHYFTKLFLDCSDVSELSYGIFRKFGFGLGKKNSNQETPLFFCLSSALTDVKEKGRIPGIVNLTKICKCLLDDTMSINNSSQRGTSVFHLIIELFQEGLNVQDEHYRDVFLHEILQLLELFSIPKVRKGVTVNMPDDDMNTPLHFWASLSLSSPKTQNFKAKMDFENLIENIFKHLLKCGVLLNCRNYKEQTPLHWCKTWRALKLLVSAGANTSDVDKAQRTPLLVAAKNRLFSRNPNHFYPDVTDDCAAFWKDVTSVGLDIIASDSDGNSIISYLLQNEVFVLAESLVQYFCNGEHYTTDEDLVDVLKAVCRDKSPTLNWKTILAKTILKSIRKPTDLNSSLRVCCFNILCTKPVYLMTDSVHWQTAKLLILYGAKGETCLDLADGFPELQDLLTKPNVDEVPMVIPWTRYSKTHQKKLNEVARRLNCTALEGTTYWYHNDHVASGAFGHVFVGINKNDSMEVAIKKIETRRMTRPELKREIQSLIALKDCKEIVQYLGFWKCEDFSYIVLELMEGNLVDYLVNSTCYDPENAIILSKDVMMGLKFLHGQNILHRDLKPSNILYKTYNNDNRIGLKIADFGLSRHSNTTPSVTVMSFNVGTRGWIAPEVVKSKNNSHSKSSDIFSCGLVLHYLFAKQQHPFNPVNYHGMSDEQILIKREGNILKYRLNGWCNSLSPEVFHLVQNMIAKDDIQRPSASDSLNHPMFWSDKKKIKFLCAVGDQEEFESPRANRPLFTVVENQLEANFHTVVRFGKWDDAGYKDMNNIITETTKPVKKSGKKGKSYKQKVRKDYKKDSVVELVRFIRNAVTHADSNPIISELILKDAIFLEYFPDLVMEVYKAVMDHGWNRRDKIKHVIENQ